jgi:putative transposase
MIALQAFKYALDPSPTKERMLRAHVGARRFAFNWGLALVKSRLDGLERGEAGAVPWTLPALRREWNRAKVSAAPWWREHSKEAYNAGLEGLAHALKNFSASKRGTRRGRRVGFPAFKRRHRGRQSVRFTTGAIRIVDRTHIQLPRIGIVRTDEPTSALREKLDAGRARILSATASLDGDRWQVSFTCLVERTVGRPVQPDVVVGADAGLRGTVTSTGEVMPNPRALPTALGKVARLNRELARRTQGSHGWRTTREQLRRAHARVRHIRQDAMHKTTTRLAKSYGVVVAETLSINGMLRSGRIARAVADAAMAELRRQLRYKCPWYGSTFIAAPRRFGSSKTCSRCGAVKAKLPLWVRVFRCEACGLELDRDLNAARNLAELAWQVPDVAGSGPETQNALSRGRKTHRSWGSPR